MQLVTPQAEIQRLKVGGHVRRLFRRAADQLLVVHSPWVVLANAACPPTVHCMPLPGIG